MDGKVYQKYSNQKNQFIFDLNLTKDYSLELMKEGRNNDLYKFQYKNLNLIVKKYPKKKLLNLREKSYFMSIFLK